MASDSNHNTLIFYLMLDTLMDTRIGTLMRINPEYAIKATGSKEYHDRTSDDFTDIIGGDYNQEDYRKVYYDRDKHTLFFSRATRMVDYIRGVITDQAIRKIAGDPRVGGLEVVINTYPIVLDRLDQAYLAKILSVALSVPLNSVKFDFRSYAEMSLSWIKTINAAVMVIYDFNEWSSQCADMPRTVEAVKTMTGNPEMILMTSGLFHTRHDLEKLRSMERSGSEDNNPFTVSKKAFAAAFCLEVLPARYFSVQQFITEQVKMANFSELQQQILLMNQIAGRKQTNVANDIIAQTEQIAEEFKETIKGLTDALVDGDWDEYRNGLGDMLVVILGVENVATIPMVDDLAKIMEKNLSKFDTDFATATMSLNAALDTGYKCEIRETEVNGVKYYPILTTDEGVIIDKDGLGKPYNKNKFLKSVNWSVEELDIVHELPKPSQVTRDELLRAAKLVQSLSSSFEELGMALLERMKSL